MNYIIELKKSRSEKKMIFLDLKRAFELIDKDIMLKKMESYGIYMLYIDIQDIFSNLTI